MQERIRYFNLYRPLFPSVRRTFQLPNHGCILRRILDSPVGDIPLQRSRPNNTQNYSRSGPRLTNLDFSSYSR